MGKGGGGGGPAPAPSSQTVTQTAIPEYARPYVETMLGQSQALTDINQNPYQTYGGQRIAEFSPLQQQAFTNAANQQTAGQLAPATGLAAASGMGALGVSGQMAGAGDRYAQQATSPQSTQAYMSPYIQAALQPQLAEMQRQYAITGQQEQGRATGAGAFGGTRNALMQAENQRNKNLAMNQAIGSGYQNAFQAAQQAQQFGANLGLQGYQGALSGLGQAGQAAGQLGQLGQTQFGQQMAIGAEQQKVGAIQQAQAQQAQDLAYQDFLKQKNYPYQQLAFMSDMLRGLPLSQSAQQVYSAPPSTASQLGGLGMSALGIYGASGGFKAKGGMVGEGYAKGGMVGYAAGGDISMMSTEQLTQMLDSPTLSPMEIEMIEKQLMLRQRIENNPEAARMMSGIGGIPTGDMVPEEGMMAGGGIVALAGGGNARKEYQNWLEEQTKKQITDQMAAKPFTKSEAQMSELAAEMKARREQAPYLALANAGLGTLAGTSQYGLTNLGLGGIEGMKSYSKSMADQSADKKLLLQQQVEAEKSELARKSGLTSAMQTSLGQLYGREAAAESSAASRAATAAATGSTALIKAQGVYKDLFNNTYEELSRSAKPGGINYKKYKDDPAQLKLDARNIALNEMAPDLKAVLGFQDPKPVVTGAPVKVTTQADYDKLKSGTKYIDPQGNERTKK
jgi:hypothetical protein